MTAAPDMSGSGSSCSDETSVVVSPVALIAGTVSVPGDKSVSHRALLFSALADGVTRIENLGPGGDVRSTRRVLEALGVAISDEVGTGESNAVVVTGRGVDGFTAPTAPLDCGNSGTTLRVMMGVLAGSCIDAVLTGDESLSRRPMERVAVPLRLMGAKVVTEGGKPPVTVHGTGELQGIDYVLPVASAQLKTAVLLAGLRAGGVTRVTESEQSRDHTELMLARMGASLVVDGLTVSVSASPLTALGQLRVPGDVSSAAFWLAAGLLVPGPGLTLPGVLLNPSRIGFLDIVRAMGGRITVDLASDSSAVELTGQITAHHSRLTAITIRGADTLRAIDEVPILAVLATQAHGRTVIADAGELRVKECDRLAVMARTLNALGAAVTETPDGLIIDGPTPLHGGRVDAELDHRIAMAAAIAALTATGPVEIVGADAAAVSYPDFFNDLGRVTTPSACRP